MTRNTASGKDGSGPWTRAVGFSPLILRATERPDRGNKIFVRWTDVTRARRERRLKRCLNVVVRRSDGAIDQTLVLVAERRLQELYVSLMGGVEPGGASPIPLTLEGGTRLALASDGSGMYPETSRQRSDVSSAVEVAKRILGRETAWRALVPSRMAQVWRHLMKLHMESGRSGPRHAEVVVSSLYAIAAWLRDNEYIQADAARPPSGWRKQLRQEWATALDREIKPARPRHSSEEMAALFDHLGSAEPRLRLAIELGAELRLGQVLRLRRSDVQVDRAGNGPPSDLLGTITVRGRGNKHGETIVLTQDQRSGLDASWSGVLKDYEAKFRLGLVDNYPLFPGGKLTGGVAIARVGRKVWNPRTALDAFHALEATAGVQSEVGRGWYGIRRTTTDLAPEFTSDDRVLDRLGGHGRETREGVYQDRRQIRFAREAAEVRDRLRRSLSVPLPSASAGDGEAPGCVTATP
jgi:hypothetical protein